MKKPLYIQFSDKIRSMILNNEYQYGQMFEPERGLEAIYGLDRKTIRKGLNILVEEGLLIRIKGKGTFVSNPDISYSMVNMGGFSSLLERQGIHSTSKVISVSEEVAGYRLAKAMKISRSTKVWKLVRQRIADEEPVALEMTYLRKELIPDFLEIDFEVYSLYDVLAKNGHEPAKVFEQIDAVEISGLEAKYLNQNEGDMVFMVTDITEDKDGKIIEFNKAYTNSTRIKLSTRLS